MVTFHNNFTGMEDIIEMKHEDFSKKPLVEQIYDELFDNIEKHAAFNEGTIKTLKQLAAKGELKKSGKVMEAIKITVAKKDETAGTGN
jgi:hypothetical protein